MCVYMIIVVDWKLNITANSCMTSLPDDSVRAPGQQSIRLEIEDKKYLGLPLIHANTETKRFINRSRQYNCTKSTFSKSGNIAQCLGQRSNCDKKSANSQ